MGFSISLGLVQRERLGSAILRIMLIAPGSFDKSGSPTVQITVSGVYGNPYTVDAIIDTGFSGFLSMPIIQAFPIGLTLYGTTTVILADGSSANKLTALGAVAIGDLKRSGVIILEGFAIDPLIGMDFIRTFELALAVTKDKVRLFDQEAIDRISQQSRTSPSR